MAVHSEIHKNGTFLLKFLGGGLDWIMMDNSRGSFTDVPISSDLEMLNISDKNEYKIPLIDVSLTNYFK